jgi:hypothetical protein
MLVVLGVGSILSIGCLMERYAPKVCNYVSSWGPATFFIYVTHYIIISYVKLLWLNSFEWNVTGSIVVPLVTLLLSGGLFVIMRKMFPSLMVWIAMLKPAKK